MQVIDNGKMVKKCFAEGMYDDFLQECIEVSFLGNTRE